ncbi:MAG TPA: OsmC family protein [Fimbriimonadaceae bacterium]|nr:OsmC family protein [Fimbriimonadaceae bacterium]HRJ95650.1 OsmC family protein [Fimbriimonadaceae bacterium]
MNNSQTIESRTTLNGVDVTALGEACKAIDQDPALATFIFRSKNQWLDGGHNRSTIEGYYGVGLDQPRKATFVMDADEPEILLGCDRGANPVEYVLHALAACVTTTMVYHAAARGMRVDRVESRLEGDLDLRGLLAMPGAKRNGYEKIVMKMKVDGDGTPEEWAEMVKFGQAHSPVFDIVSNGTEIDVQFEGA